MNIAELKGEKNVKTLAKGRFRNRQKKTSQTSQKEMEAALHRLNPRLKQIGDLAKQTTIAVPEEFVRAAVKALPKEQPKRSLRRIKHSTK